MKGNEAGRWLARTTIALVLLLAFVLGAFIGGCSLHDPDTCWLIASGKWLFEHKALPETDPFSYSYPLLFPGKAPVLYQWLSEVLMFMAYRLGNLPGVLAMVAAILSLAFIALPLRFLRGSRVDGLLSVALIVLSAAAASFHFLARPEMFSFLLLVVWSNFLLSVWKQTLKPWQILGGSFFLMSIWSNLHSAFVIGLILNLACLLAVILEDFVWGVGQAKIRALSLLLASGVAGSFFTPYGLSLWLYLPRLFFMPFNMPFNAQIVELRPLSLLDLGSITFIPFVLLTILASSIVANAGLQMGWRTVGFFVPTLLVLSTIAGIACRRMIPFSSLVVLIAVGFVSAFRGGAGSVFVREPGTSKHQIVESWRQFTTAGLNGMAGANLFALPILSVIGMLWTVLNVVPPSLPQPSRAFQMPLTAIKHLSGRKFNGRILNDPQFGDLMIWHLKEKIPVFIDTRFDMYGAKVVLDYLQMIGCRGDWRALLDFYRIELVFLPPGAKLVAQLESRQDRAQWSETYRDSSAVILERKVDCPFFSEDGTHRKP